MARPKDAQQPEPQGISPEALVQRLGQQIGGLTVEIAMRDMALEAAHAEIARLKGEAEEEPANGRAG